MPLNPCKHLDHSDTYTGSCDLVQLDNGVKYWRRREVPYDGAPVNVQFCGQGRGRINSILACYLGEMGSCYEPEAGQQS